MPIVRPLGYFRHGYSGLVIFLVTCGLLILDANAAGKTSNKIDRHEAQDSTGGPEQAAEPGPRGLGARYENELDVLDRVASLGEAVARRIQGRDVGQTTQQMQRQILNELDRLLRGSSQRSAAQGAHRTTERESQQPGERSQVQAAQGTQPGQASGPANDSQGSPRQSRWDPEFQRMINEIWGQLPPRERPPIAEQLFETIIPRYRSLVEAYYRELARARRESVPGAGAAGPRPNR